MAIPWLTVLQSVPWSEVISNAPKVAEGARKLWKAVARRSAAPGAAAPAARAGAAPGAGELEARVAALEATVSDLHGQMLASSELIKALAEQNALLVQRAESQRTHVRRLGWGVALLALLVLFALLPAF